MAAVARVSKSKGGPTMFEELEDFLTTEYRLGDDAKQFVFENASIFEGATVDGEQKLEYMEVYQRVCFRTFVIVVPL